jgi:hypothetical protein
LFLASCVAFAAMVVVDTGVVRVDESRRHLFEDGPKFFGILNWTAWVVGACVARMKRLTSLEAESE